MSYQNIEIQPLIRTGARNERRDAIARSRHGALLALCLSAVGLPEMETEAKQWIQVAIIASKKQVSKRAVKRNRAKRRLRMAIRSIDTTDILAAMKKKQIWGLKLLLVCQKTAIDLNFEELKAQVGRCLERLVSQLPESVGH